MVDKKVSKVIIIVAVGVVALLVAIAVIQLPAPYDEEPLPEFPEIGYELSSIVTSDSFMAPSDNVTLSTNGGSLVDYDTTSEGLKIFFNQTSSALYIEKASTEADCVRMLIDISAIDSTHSLDVKTMFRVEGIPSWYYGVTIYISEHLVSLYPNVGLGDGTPRFQNFEFVYDSGGKETIDVVVKVQNGNVDVGIDGFEISLKTDYEVRTDLMFDKVTLSSGSNKWSSPAEIFLKRFEIGNNAQVVFHDRLHVTLTPWGHDFTISMQIHADDANPAQLALFRYLADYYGVRGEFSAFEDLSDFFKPTQFSIKTNESYKNELLALQSSGWDIGLHAAIPRNANRTEVLSLIDQFQQAFGPLPSWVDHGQMYQDIWQQGNDPGSDYYVSDYLVENDVMIWVNQENNSHSRFQDLNLDTVVYQNGLYPGLDLLRVSKYGINYETNGWQAVFAPVTQDELSARQRVYAINGAVLLYHDYTLKYTYVEDGGVNYATQNLTNMGYPYTLITDIANARTHENGTWHLMPWIEDYFAAMKEDYDVWYATPREIYDRSMIMDGLTVEENATAVSITNPSASGLPGLTIFTKERPSYCLKVGGTYYYAEQGAESWHFVIPSIAAGASIELAKAEPPTSSHSKNEGFGRSPAVMYMVDRQGDGANITSNVFDLASVTRQEL